MSGVTHPELYSWNLEVKHYSRISQLAAKLIVFRKSKEKPCNKFN